MSDFSKFGKPVLLIHGNHESEETVKEGVKLFENGKVIDEPKLTAKQWQLVSKSKELPKQITLLNDAVSVTDSNEFVIDPLVNRQDIESILSATYETDVKDAKNAKEVIHMINCEAIIYDQVLIGFTSSYI